jgi:hypothetical protein
MWGLMTPAILILWSIACLLGIPLIIGLISAITYIGKAMGL